MYQGINLLNSSYSKEQSDLLFFVLGINSRRTEEKTSPKIEERIMIKKDSPKYEKLIRENRAKRILGFIFPTEYSKARLSDRPDIVSPSIGCEVTNSLITPIFEILSREPSVFHGDFYPLKEKVEKILNERGREIGLEEGIHDYERIYLQKLKNLNSGGYQLFEENNLFIFSWIYEEKAVMEFLELAEKPPEHYKYTFDRIYLFFDQVLVEMILGSGEYRIYPLEEGEQRRILKRSAREVRIKTLLHLPL